IRRNQLSRLSLPMEIRTDVSTLRAARLAGKPGLDFGQPDVIRPPVAADGDPVAALVIRAINQQTANARSAHLSEGDLLLAGAFGHAPLKRAMTWRASRVGRAFGFCPRDCHRTA